MKTKTQNLQILGVIPFGKLQKQLNGEEEKKKKKDEKWEVK